MLVLPMRDCPFYSREGKIVHYITTSRRLRGLLPNSYLLKITKKYFNPNSNKFLQKWISFRMRVTCDDTHLHFINMHQFVDSPEWEANHEQSDDVFQVTITAEEDSVYLCWDRMKLERVLRHRPMLKTVFDCIIGKYYLSIHYIQTYILFCICLSFLSFQTQ